VVEIAGSDSFARGLGSLKKWLSNDLGNLSSHVNFLGHLNADDLGLAYDRAWVVIIPSRWDNFPTVLLEAMTRGKPVVASSNGGMPEMLENTLCSTASPATNEFTNRIEKLFLDPVFRKQAGDSLRRKAEREYSPEVVVQKYISTIYNFVENR
jgi:glycosyltransferase involved in cell wall biosynthesis